jgi:hypothetical protein
MKTTAIIAASFCLAGAAMADDSCAVQATGKSLHGAALASFAKKCCKESGRRAKTARRGRNELHQEVRYRRRREVNGGGLELGARRSPPPTST